MAHTSIVTPRRILVLAVFLLLCTFAWVWCAPGGAPRHNPYAIDGEQPVPPGAKVTLEVDRPEYVIGENVLVHFVLENRGAEPFEVSRGGDYRQSGRATRYKVTAEDENGRIVADPFKEADNLGGGLMGSEVLKPGGKLIESLPLMRYCDINKAGVYTIRASHDCGWTEGKRKYPAGECTIRFRMPDAAEAERVVAEMERLSTDHWSGSSGRSPAYADYTSLRLPIYLEPLKRRALQGNSRALDGIADMAIPEATEAIIRIALESNGDVLASAVRVLNGRLPIKGQLNSRIAKVSWDAKFEPEARALATKILSQNEPVHVIMEAATLTVFFGKPEDAPVVFAALDRALEQTVAGNERRDFNDNIFNLPEPAQQLIHALDALRTRGYTLQDDVSSPAKALMYFEWIGKESLPRPPEWAEHLKTFGDSENLCIRDAALRSVPKPMPGECKEFVLRRLADADLGVRRSACAVAGASGDRDFLKPLMEIVATERNLQLVQEASDAAKALGANYELLEVWAGRLTEENMDGPALQVLVTALEMPAGRQAGGAAMRDDERVALHKAWKEFLSGHADEIRRGTRVKPDNAAALFGRALRWELEDGSAWPPALPVQK